MKLIVHTDGGARGNPGPAAVGVVIEEETRGKRQETGKTETLKEIAAFGKQIGETTNNVAEYLAVIEALRYIKEQIAKNREQTREQLIIQCYLDSVLVVNQLNGVFKIKDARLRELLATARILEQEIGGTIQYNSIPREQNTRADAFVNRALDYV
jgi:ribonuclease HI